MNATLFVALLLCGMARGMSGAADFDWLCADRAAGERVHSHHRLGDKPPFEPWLSGPGEEPASPK